MLLYELVSARVKSACVSIRFVERLLLGYAGELKLELDRLIDSLLIRVEIQRASLARGAQKLLIEAGVPIR